MMWSSTNQSNLTYLSVYNYHLFTETEGNGVFCGLETEEELQYEYICPIWLEKSDFFTATGEFAFCDRPLK
jgi:hypothetical protein